MTPAEAARLIELPLDATPDQLEARFLELRRKLEDKIAKAPTPGLQAKYRESLTEITTAFETLTLAADSSALPVLKKQSAKGEEPSVGGQRTDDRGRTTAGSTATPPRGSDSANPKSRIQNRKSGKEFALVAVIAIAVLGAGGWFVLKTRAENAEKARSEAEARATAEAQAAAEKAERERLAEDVRQAAEAKRLAEEQARAREAEEKVRVDKLTASLLAQLAESKVAWEAFEDEQRNAERRLSDLKSDLRNTLPAGKRAQAEALAAAQEEYLDWLTQTLSRHPAKMARARAEQLSSARQTDEAQEAVSEVQTALAQLEEAAAASRRELLAVTGSLTLSSEPTGLDWVVTDAFGVRHTGRTPDEVADVGIGPAEIVFSRAGWADHKQTVHIARNRRTTATAEFAPGDLEITSSPSGAEVWSKGKRVGATPFSLTVPPGRHDFQLKLNKYEEATASLTVLERQTTRTSVTMVKTKPRFVAGDGPNPLWAAQVTSAEFQAALLKGLSNGAGKYSVRLPGIEDNVQIEVSWQSFAGPKPGFTMTARATALWILRYQADGTALWSQTNTETRTAGVSDAIDGGKRMRLVSEGARQAALAAGLVKIAQLRTE